MNARTGHVMFLRTVRTLLEVFSVHVFQAMKEMVLRAEVILCFMNRNFNMKYIFSLHYL